MQGGCSEVAVRTVAALQLESVVDQRQLGLAVGGPGVQPVRGSEQSRVADSPAWRMQTPSSGLPFGSVP